MTWLKRLNAYNRGLMSAENEGGTGGGADAASILFGGGEGDEGNDTQAGGEGNDTQAGGEGGEAKSEWKEYQNDPAKSDEENAAAKAEHDKTKPADDAGKADTVPEDGKYSLTMPEGVELDAEMLDALGGDFKELGLTNAQAQKLADKFISVQQKRGEAQNEAWANTVKGWGDAAQKDEEIGGTRWGDTAKVASGFAKEFFSDTGREFLEASGAGNHPEMIRMARNAGKTITDLRAKVADLEKQLTGEDKPAVGGAGGGSQPVKPETLLFPTEGKKG